MQTQYSLRSPAVKRLMREAHELKDPTEQFYAQPLEDNLFEWHFTIRGPADSEFDGGIYHGRIVLPPEYPMKPPSIIMLTPNGRFEVHRKICLSISGHHPESWQPSWSIRTAMLAIIGFMPTHGSGAIGSLDYTSEERKRLAKRTQDWKCPNCGRVTDVLLPVTEASKATSQEAKELASQIDFQGEKESKNATDKPRTAEAVPASDQTLPTGPNPAANPNMMGMFGPAGVPPGMRLPVGMPPGMASMMAAMATQPPRFPPQFWPPMFRPPMPPRGGAPVPPGPGGMQPPMFWPPGFASMMQMQRGGTPPQLPPQFPLQPPPQPRQQSMQQQPTPASSSPVSSTSTPTTATSSATSSTGPSQSAPKDKPATQTPTTSAAPANTASPDSAAAVPSTSSASSPDGATKVQASQPAPAAAPASPASGVRQRTVPTPPRVITTPRPAPQFTPLRQQPQQELISGPAVLALMFVIGFILLVLLMRRLYLLYLTNVVGFSADEL